MDKKSKTILWISTILIVMSIIASYYRVFVLKDYEIIKADTQSTE